MCHTEAPLLSPRDQIPSLEAACFANDFPSKVSALEEQTQAWESKQNLMLAPFREQQPSITGIFTAVSYQILIAKNTAKVQRG